MSNQPPNHPHGRAALAIADGTPLVPGEPIQLTPDGTFRARDGRPAGLAGWRLDAPIAERLRARLAERGNPIVIDYEHQTLNAEANGAPAPAAGWIDPAGIEYRPGAGLFAAPRWTERAAGMIAAREIAFVSPVLLYDPASGDVVDIHSAGLTNTPAVHGMRPLAALAERLGLSTHHPEDTPMDLAAVRSLLGLPDDADEAAILQAITELKGEADEVASLTEQIAALKQTATPDPKEWVPAAVHAEAIAALKAATATADAGALDTLIEQGMAAGKIPGQSTAEWLRGQGMAAAREYLKDAPGIAALKSTQTQGQAPAGAAGDSHPKLAAEELAVCKQMGIDHAAYLNTRTELFPETRP
jgi:phage I-like protein